MRATAADRAYELAVNARDDTVVHCPHAARCPGCAYIGRPYGEQREEKRERLRAALSAYTELSGTEARSTEPAEPITGYRRRAKLVVAGKDVGLFAAGSHRVVDIPECRVLDPSIAVVASAARSALPLPAPVSALDLRATDEGVFATLVVPASAGDLPVRAAVEEVAKAEGVIGVAVSRRDEGSVQVLGRAPEVVVGSSRARCRVTPGGPYHYAAPGAFAQAHAGQQRALVQGIARAIEEKRGSLRGARVLELFAGSGALSLELASLGASCTAVEAYAPSVALARDAAREQSLDVTAAARDAAVAARAFVEEGRAFDVVVVNPPRRGLHPELRERLPLLSRALCVYVSCEPVTLARDLADLSRRGLRPLAVAPFDMMPLTADVETLAVLEPGAPPAPIVLHEDERLIAVDKPPHLPTTPQGEHAGSLLRAVQTACGAPDAVPVHRLDVGTSGVCLFARRPEYVEVFARSLKEGQKEYVALAKGVTRPKGSIARPVVEHGRPQEARTRYSRREVVAGHSLLLVRPDQGRRHQIRRHLASVGHAVVGDERYGDARTAQYFALRHFLDRPFLHLARVILRDGDRDVELTAELAPDLRSVLASMRGAAGGD